MREVRAAGVKNVRVILEPDPTPWLPSKRRMFVGNLEGHAGKDRSQFSNFWMSNYTSAQVVGFSDAEVCLHMPIIPPLVFDLSDGSNPRLRNVAHLSGDGWGPDPWVLGHETPLDAMLTDRFPIFIWRKHLVQFRQHVARRFGRTAADYGGDEAAAFNEAFTDMTNANRTWGKYQYGAAKRWVWSQFNLFSNYVFNEPSAARRYVWHTPTKAAHHLPAAKALPGYASVSMQPWVTIGENHGKFMQGSRLSCCAMFAGHPSCTAFADDAHDARRVGIRGIDAHLVEWHKVSCLRSMCPGDFRCKKNHPAWKATEWPPQDESPCKDAEVSGLPVAWQQMAPQVLQSVLLTLASYVSKMPTETTATMQSACFDVPKTE